MGANGHPAGTKSGAFSRPRACAHRPAGLKPLDEQHSTMRATLQGDSGLLRTFIRVSEKEECRARNHSLPPQPRTDNLQSIDS